MVDHLVPVFWERGVYADEGPGARIPARETHVGANGRSLAVFRHDLGRPAPEW